LVSGIKVLDKKSNERRTINADGVFVEIGYLPNNQLLVDQLDLNDRGEVVVNALNETSMPGVFAAGDVTDTPYKQIIVAASEGAKAALTANDYLNRGK
jgi:alkyl hydroperoxide reductase subunit F